MALRLPDPLRVARAQTVIDRAGNGALIRIYSGTQPADADVAASGTLLAQLVGGTPFGTISTEGVLTMSAITQDSSADATGTAGWFRITNAAGSTTVLDGSVTATGGGGELQLVSTGITAGQPVQISSFVFTEQGAT